jgi:hypothetical protein
MEEQQLRLGLSEDDILDAQLEMVNESVAVYNDLYGTNYTIDTLPDAVLSFVAINTLMTLNGWNNQYTNDFDADTIQILESVYGEGYREYGGIVETNRKIVNNNEEELTDTPENTDEQVEQNQEKFIETRTEVLFAGLFVSYQITQSLLADNDGKRYVGVITRDDGKVRREHEPNNEKYWERSTRRDFSRDYGCRCTYFYFATEEGARQAGFTKFS